MKTLPNVPTMEEQGVPNYRIIAWVAVFGPAGLPADVTRRLNEAVGKALAQPEMQAFVDQIGSDPLPTSPAGLAEFVREDAKRWVEIVETAQIERK